MTRLPFLDSLRGLAILLVMAYHLHPAFGGYIGVDVFFVLSGYVLALSLTRNPAPYAFLQRRLLRLLPAVAVLVMGMALLLPLAFPSYAAFLTTRLLGSLFFLTPFQDAGTPAYFLTTYSMDMLAHTWSVGVELHVSLLFFAAAFLPIQHRDRLIAVLTLCSFLFFLLPLFAFTERFHLAPFRFWEFGLGWLVACGWRLPHTPRLPILGWMLLALALLVGSTGLILLGAGLAAMGTTLLLHSPNHSSGPRALTALGLVSYGVYLWHLPLFFLFDAWFVTTPLLGALLAVAASLIAGTLSWYLVERPCLALSTARWPFLFGLTTASLALLLVSLTQVPDGPILQDERWQACHLDAGDPTTIACATGTDVVLIGDSHAGVLGGALDSLLTASGRSLTQITRNGCPPAGPALSDAWPAFPEQARHAALCQETQAAMRAAITTADAVIVSTHWTRHTTIPSCPDCPYLHAMQTFLQDLDATDTPYVVIGPLPESPWPVAWTLGIRAALGMSLPLENTIYNTTRQAPLHAWLDAPGLPWLDPMPVLCDPTCLTHQGGLLVLDTDHLTPAGAHRLLPAVLDKLFSHP